MRKAINLAKKGYNKVHPNPMVGCVIVKNNKIAGKGYHEYFGGPHAEINALKQAGREAKDSTLYVNLEPCNHWGKTPPCTDAIIKTGVKRVVIASCDPAKHTIKKGIKKLKASGIQVKCGLLARQADKINRVYFKAVKAKRPYVILKMAMSMDGKIATYTGDSKWISCKESRKHVHKIRAGVDGILIGKNTVLKDNPELTSHGLGRNPVRIVIDPYLEIPINSKILNGKTPCIIIYNRPKVKVKYAQLKRKTNVIPVSVPANKSGDIDFENILKKLSKMSINRILIEGGGETAANALRSRIVNESILIIAPKIIGGRDAKTPIEGKGAAKILDATKLTDLKVNRIKNDVIIQSKVCYS